MKRFLLTILISLTLTGTASAQSFSLETYVPPPVGVYDQLRLEPSPTPNTSACESGSFFYDNIIDDIFFCQDDGTSANAGNWMMFAPVWVTQGDNTFIKNVSSYAYPDQLFWLIGPTSRDQANKGDQALTIRADNPANSDGSILAVGTDGGFGATLPNRAALNGGSSANGRFIWYPRKSAFRVGTVSGTQWDDANIGSYSAAFGGNTTASAIHSFAAGSASVASGTASVAMGEAVAAQGANTYALGQNTTTTNASSKSFALGTDTVVSGANSYALGNKITVSGTNSIGIGLDTVASNTTLSRNNTMAIMGGDLDISDYPWIDAMREAHNLRLFNDDGSAQILIGYSSDDIIPKLELSTSNDFPNNGRWEMTTGGSAVAGPGDKMLFRYVDSVSTKDVLTILQNSNIGIGTTAPAADLHILNGWGGARLKGADVSTLTLENLLDDDFRIHSQLGGQLFILTRTGSNAFATRFFLNQNGNLGIETTTPQADLALFGSGNMLLGDTVDPSIEFKNANSFKIKKDTGDGGLQFTSSALVPAGSDVAMHITYGGQVGIRTTAPAAGVALDVVGTMTALSTTQGSSRALKENIQDLSFAEAKSTLAGLHPLEFTYISDQSHDRRLGFIAEDVPNLVATPNRNSISPMDILGILTKVMQEQQETLETQQKEINELKDKLEKKRF